MIMYQTTRWWLGATKNNDELNLLKLLNIESSKLSIGAILIWYDIWKKGMISTFKVMKVTKGIGLVSSDEIRSEYRNWGENDAQMRQSQFINLYMNMILNYRQISNIKYQISKEFNMIRDIL